MMATATKRLLLALGMGAMLTTTLMILRPGTQAKAPEPELAPVLVMTKPVAAYQVLDEAHVSLQRRPVAHVPPGALSSLSDALGKRAGTDLYPGEVLLAAKLSDAAEAPGSLTIPEGLRAVTVSANEVSGVGGFVRPGSRVDVVATWDVAGKPQTRLLLQDVLVIAVAQESGAQDKPKVPSSVTLAVDPASTERLVLASERGSLRLAMRSPGEKRVVATAGSTPETLAGKPAAAPKRVQVVRKVVHPAPPRRAPLGDPPVVVLRGEPSAP